MTSERVPYTQAGRMMAISTPLGQDTLLLDKLEIDEAVNALFEVKASVKSQRDDLKPGDLIGKSVDYQLKLKDDGKRWWNGLVTELHEGPLTSRATRSYAMVVRPKLWLLTRKRDCRIFLNQTSQQVVETLCKEHGVADLEFRLTGKQTPLDYSVQWNESDLAYMLRRMQQDGLFYWFEHQQGKHTLVVADHQSAYRDSPEVQPRFALGSTDADHITQWRRSFAFVPGKRAGRDWNFLTMQAPEGDQTSFVSLPGNAQEELYEYPGRFLDTSGAEQAMKYRIQATETGYESVEAVSTVRAFGPGQKIAPQDKTNQGDQIAPQVVTAIRHRAVDQTYETGSDNLKDARPSYENSFTTIPAATPATPHRTVPRPTITGTQIALIAGPDGEEIFTDEYGRVKVWFPWDRRAKKDGSDTVWIRVGQPWAGGTWGHQVIPRVGMEALVSYAEGNPDRPFVFALVPDPTNAVPYDLPDNKTKMVYRSKSYKSSGNNEMTFEDATGAENMFFHASKDQTSDIVNNRTKSVGANESNSVGQNQSTTIGQNVTTEVGGSMNLTVGGTGAGAASLMGPLMGMVGGTSDMLGQALSVAGGALGGLAGGSSAPTGAASPLGSLAGAASGGFGGLGGLMSSATSMVPSIASAGIGLLGAAGQQAQSGVVDPSNSLSDAGAALAQSGASLASAVGGLFQMPGMLNVTVGTMRTDSIGIAHAMQVGMSQAVNIGMTKAETIGQAHTHTVGQQMIVNVGEEMQINVGKVFQIIVGNSTLTMDSGGNVTITGKTFPTTFSDHVKHYGKSLTSILQASWPNGC